MIRRVWKLALLALVVLAGSAVPAWAQEDVPPRMTIMAGYSYLIDRSWQEKLPKGLVAALSHRLTETVSIVGEASGSRGKLSTTPFTIERWAFLGGVKLQSTGGGEGLMPFVQALAGLSRQAGDVGVLNGFAVQAGGGVDLRLSSRLSARAFADYRWIREKSLNFTTYENWNQYRVGGGIVIALRR